MSNGGRGRKKRGACRTLPAPASSLRFLARLAPRNVGMFRFLLESFDNLAYFTVLDAEEALLVIVCSPHQEAEARAALDAVGECLPLEYAPWPLPVPCIA
jgi:hypothetical protein